jgi:hypothetical protein
MNTSSSYDLKTELLPASKKMTEEVAAVCMKKSIFLNELMEIAFSTEKIISWHACWVIETIARKDINKLADFSSLLINELPSLKHPSQIRPIFGTVSLLNFDCEEQLHLLDFCIEKLTNAKSKYNEKSRALIVLQKFIAFEPELKKELFPIVEESLLFEEKAHFRKRMKEFLSL